MNKRANLFALFVTGAMLLTSLLHSRAWDGGVTGYIRLAHFAAQTETIDIYLDGEAITREFSVGSTGEFLAVRPGIHTLVIVPAGNSINTPLLAPVELTIVANHRYMTAVTRQIDNGCLKVIVVDEAALTSDATLHQQLSLNMPDLPEAQFHKINEAAQQY